MIHPPTQDESHSRPLGNPPRFRFHAKRFNAQEGMAWWAELMFYATAATVLLTFAALGAIIRTLHHTKRAADYTEHMLAEAKATTNEARTANEIMRAEQRPWIVIGLEYLGNTGVTDRQASAKLRFKATNVGKTPALNCKISVESTGSQPGDDGPRGTLKRIVEREIGYFDGYFAIMPGETRACGQSGFPSALISDSSFPNGGLNERAALCGDGSGMATA